MANNKRLHEKQTPEHPFVYEYQCVCGQLCELSADKKPKRLERCFDDQFKFFEGAI